MVKWTIKEEHGQYYLLTQKGVGDCILRADSCLKWIVPPQTSDINAPAMFPDEIEAVWRRLTT